MNAEQRALPIRLSIAAPAYNEVEGIEQIVDSWVEYLGSLADVEGFEIVICNDGSTDGTGALLDRIAARRAELRVVHHSGNRGAGAALRSAIAATIEPWVLLIDSDGQFPLDNLEPMLSELERGAKHGVMGSREKHGSFAARVGSQLSGKCCNALYGTSYRDFNSALKLLEGALVRSLPLEARGLNYSTEVTARLAERGIVLQEVPIRHEDRQSGVSSVRFLRDATSRFAFVAYLALRQPLLKNGVIDEVPR